MIASSNKLTEHIPKANHRRHDSGGGAASAHREHERFTSYQEPMGPGVPEGESSLRRGGASPETPAEAVSERRSPPRPPKYTIPGVTVNPGSAWPGDFRRLVNLQQLRPWIQLNLPQGRRGDCLCAITCVINGERMAFRSNHSGTRHQDWFAGGVTGHSTQRG